ncbi:MAG TPA: hypothetical protein VGN69_07075 [Solirubrobacteraceae bacterium]|nr:hypothetical protein [Solirubrobacteraceae bacterium]
MGMLAWVMMGLAVWHYTIFLPDRFWGGIVGALMGALVGAIVAGLLIHLARSGVLAVPGRKQTEVLTVLYAVPGAIVGMGLTYLEGARRERRSPPASG